MLRRPQQCDVLLTTGARVTRVAPKPTISTSTSWRERLPVLVSEQITLRELRDGDAPALMAMLTSSEVVRFISPPPSTLDGFDRLIHWARREREQGGYVCFAVVPHGMTAPVGLFQLRRIEKGFVTAEWGFALGSAYWGTGIFSEAARLLVDFAVETIGVRRLEARAVAANGRGNGALRKIGAVQEGRLRRAFLKDGRYVDQVLWSILADEWRESKALAPIVH